MAAATDFIKNNFMILTTVASVAFGVGGFASSHSVATVQQVHDKQIEDVIKTIDKVVGVQEKQSEDISALVQWAKDHEANNKAVESYNLHNKKVDSRR